MLTTGSAGTLGGGSGSTTAATTTPLLFATTLLTAMGWPTTQSNIAAMVSWEQAEGGNWENPDAYNPLDTTMPEPGAVSTNGPGVKKYTSWAQGLQATIATLKLSYYPQIRASFAGGNASQTLVPTASGELRTWGTNPAAIQSGIDSGSWQRYSLKTGGSGIGGPGLSSGGSSSSSSSTSGCAFGIGPFCILSSSGVAKLEGSLIMVGGSLAMVIGMGLIVIATLAETRLGRNTQRAFGAAGVGQLVGAAQAPARAVSARRQAREAQAASTARTEAQQRESAERSTRRAQLERARVRRERARAREAEGRARQYSPTAPPQGFTRAQWAQMRREGRVSVKAS